MGTIGYFGSNRFETSTPLTGFQRSTAAKFETFERVGLKPLTEYIAPGLDTASFTLAANATLGINPRVLLDKWKAIAAAGVPDVLVIGGKAMGTDLWVLKSAAENWDTFDGSGNVLTGTIALSFEEYMTS